MAASSVHTTHGEFLPDRFGKGQVQVLGNHREAVLLAAVDRYKVSAGLRLRVCPGKENCDTLYALAPRCGRYLLAVPALLLRLGVIHPSLYGEPAASMANRALLTRLAHCSPSFPRWTLSLTQLGGRLRPHSWIQADQVRHFSMCRDGDAANPYLAGTFRAFSGNACWDERSVFSAVPGSRL